MSLATRTLAARLSSLLLAMRASPACRPPLAARPALGAGLAAAPPRAAAAAARRALAAAADGAAVAPPPEPAAPPPKAGRGGASAAAGDGAAGLIDLNPPRGTRDFPPDEKRLQNWLFGEFSAVSRLFGFEQVDFPVLESEALFVRKAGEEIVEQLYAFEDRGGRRVALRPELTPSLARLALGRGKALALPAKWFAIGQCWRYERATRGRRREHYQWNMDVVGVPGVEAEAELLAAVTTLLARVGLGPAQVGIKVSSRKVLAAVLARASVPDALFGPVAVVVDKIEKLPRAAVAEQLGALGVPPAAADAVLAALAARSLPELEALLGAEDEAIADLRRLFTLAEAYGYAEWLVLDASVVRGLAYYTGVVFEGFDRAGRLRALFGGGRYDGLLGTFGGEDKPCAGFGFGDAVIVELLKEEGLLPAPAHAVDDLVVALEPGLGAAACGVAARLRAAGRAVDLALEPGRKMKWAFKQAERAGAARLVLVAPDEWARGAVRVKELATGEQRDVPLEELG
jgi:histidyl-tRNA synthetase